MNESWDILKALSDPTRLRIMALLEAGELSVTEIHEITRLGQSRISTHLGLLTEAGLVALRKEGRRSFYGPGPGMGAAESTGVASTSTPVKGWLVWS